ncbi:unnamed protein product [Cylindrotheca closterium]|uniref:Uncharacterized protein n=1 Tax=Cylindrotheca closterium TaxID=2856 RepID=A0AAD2JIT5_9STRA|nr:unnamed protein product [Cylindrotheca closterium]
MTSRGYNKTISEESNKGSSRQNFGPNSDDNRRTNRFSSVKNSLQTCMGFVDGLCCANLNQVAAEDREERSRANLRNYMTSYDLSYLNSNIGDPANKTGDATSSHSSHSSSQEEEGTMPPSATESKTPPVEKCTTGCVQNLSSMQHAIPNREFGHSGHSGHSQLPVMKDTGIQERTTMDEGYNHDDSSSCCHSFQQFHGFEDYGGCQGGQDSQFAQPHTLQSADTYTTVSLSQSYSTMMWDDEEDEEEEEDSNSDYFQSPLDSVFRKDEEMEEASVVEHRDPPSCSQPPSFPTSAAFATKTHEAYQYLLRMTPQNYLHGSGSSSEDLEAENYCHSNHTTCVLESSSSTVDINQCGPLFLH